MFFDGAGFSGFDEGAFVAIGEVDGEVKVDGDSLYQARFLVFRPRHVEGDTVGGEFPAVAIGKDIVSSAGADGDEEEVKGAGGRVRATGFFGLVGEDLEAFVVGCHLFAAGEGDVHGVSP